MKRNCLGSALGAIVALATIASPVCRAETADSLNKSAGRVDLGLPPPPMKVEAGDKWVVFPWTNDVKPGTILDFSKVTPRDEVVGSLGFARVSREGHFVFEKDAKKAPRQGRRRRRRERPDDDVRTYGEVKSSRHLLIIFFSHLSRSKS